MISAMTDASTTLFMEHNLLPQMRDILRQQFGESHIALVCDDNTIDLAGYHIASALGEQGLILNLGRRVKPTTANAELLKRQAARCDAIVAIGSGTLTDLCKYVGHRLDIPAAVFCTAPSMNGYLSPTASLLMGKVKSSVKARVPSLVVADMDILSHSPLRMLRAGIGDLFCRNTIESDLILANALTGESYDPRWFDELKSYEDEIRNYEGELYQRDEGIIRTLMQALLLGGRMMQQFGSSKPCSQSEHMIAHTYELMYGTQSELLHGEAICITTTAMSKLQQKLIQRKPRLKPFKLYETSLRRIFGPAMVETIKQQVTRKTLSEEQCEALNDQMPQIWPDIKAKVEACSMRAIALENFFRKHNCYTEYNQVRWNKDRFEHAMTNAYLTRDRFTFLDICAMDKTLRAEF